MSRHAWICSTPVHHQTLKKPVILNKASKVSRSEESRCSGLESEQRTGSRALILTTRPVTVMLSSTQHLLTFQGLRAVDTNRGQNRGMEIPGFRVGMTLMESL